MIDTYFKYGEPLFRKFDSVEKIASMFTIDDFKKKDCVYTFGPVTLQRGVLAMAKIHHHLGNMSKAKEFAVFGLQNLGRATILQPQYEEIINKT